MISFCFCLWFDAEIWQERLECRNKTFCFLNGAVNSFVQTDLFPCFSRPQCFRASLRKKDTSEEFSVLSHKAQDFNKPVVKVCSVAAE